MQTQTIIINAGVPAWLPFSLVKQVEQNGSISCTDSFSAADKKIMRTPRQIKMSRWVEKYRVITTGPRPGAYKNRTTPYMTDIMDASISKSVRTIIICACPQAAKSTTADNFVAYITDRDPGDVLYVYPDEQTAKENSRDRIIPMIQASPKLAEYMTAADDDMASIRIKLQHMAIYMAWARSAARLANKPIRYVIFDEIDKYPPTAGKREAAPIALGEKRTQTFRRMGKEKIWKISTPTIESAPIWQAMTKESQVIFDFWTRCPFCDELQLMTFSQIKWPRDPESGEHPNAERTVSEKLAWYECKHCKKKWNDDQRDHAVRAGEWHARSLNWQKRDDWQQGKPGLKLFAYLKKYQPAKIGFHIPARISPFVSISENAGAFLKYKHSGKLDDFKDFKNNFEAEPWKQITISTSEKRILEARCELSPETVPEDAVLLTCGVDIHKFGFWFAVRAWAVDYTSWLIHYGLIQTWEDVEQLLFQTAYPKAESDTTLRIFRAAVDTGCSIAECVISMTEEAYWWLRKNASGRGARVWGTKGASHPQATKVKLGTVLERTPAGKPIPGGMRLITIDTLKAKDAYHYHLQRAIEGLPQGAYLHAETGRDYASQILAEEKEIDDKGNERWVQKHSNNHLFDCECLAQCCADPEWPGGGIHLYGRQARQQSKGRRIVSKGL
jgi:phage terminase large subunit GpA-like protein